MENKITICVPEDNTERIDKFLAINITELSRSLLVKLFDQKKIKINGNTVLKSYKVKPGDEIEIEVPELTEIEAVPENIPLDIVFEDDDILVVNKEKGIVVHPAVGNNSGTLVNALLYHCKDSLSGINGVIRPGIVHRIDKDTSGLLIVAKNDMAHRHLAEQIKEHSFLREYEAVVCGNVKDDEGIIDAPIGRNKKDRKKMCVTFENSKNAITNYKVIKRYVGFTHIRCRLETGRTHQIRVHMAYIGHPVAGDKVYGAKRSIDSLKGQCLHAKIIGFVHPSTKENLFFDSQLPKYFFDFLSKLTPLEREDYES